MTPSQRQLIKEAYQAGYYGALNEAPSRATILYLQRLAKRVAREIRLQKQGFTLNRQGHVIDPETGKRVSWRGKQGLENRPPDQTRLGALSRIRRKAGGLQNPTNPDLDIRIGDAIFEVVCM